MRQRNTAIAQQADHRNETAGALLDALCELFDDELERQENVLAISRGQGEAARAHDTADLEARTQALVNLLEEAFEAENKRVALLRKIVDCINLPAKHQTLTELIEVTAEPWRRRMQEFQTGIRKTLTETRKVVIRNADFMRRALQISGDSLREIVGNATASSVAYENGGRAQVHAEANPTLIDAKG